MLCLQGWDAEEATDRSLQALFILNGRYMREVEELRQARAAHIDRQDIVFPIGEFWGPQVVLLNTSSPATCVGWPGQPFANCQGFLQTEPAHPFLGLASVQFISNNQCILGVCWALPHLMCWLLAGQT